MYIFNCTTWYLHKILQDQPTLRGQDGFRVELHPVDGVFCMLHRHHLAVGGAGGDFKLLRQGGGVCRQRVIPRHQQRGFAAAEQRARGVKFHLGLLAVHELLCIGDGSTNRPPQWFLLRPVQAVSSYSRYPFLRQTKNSPGASAGGV